MVKLTTQDVLNIAKLANLKLTKKETAKFASQLSSIISYVDELKKVDTQDFEPTSQTTGLVNIYRKDEINITNVLSQEDVLQAPMHNGYFVVGAVLNEDQEAK